jgi:hypothetical protein
MVRVQLGAVELVRLAVMNFTGPLFLGCRHIGNLLNSFTYICQDNSNQ